MPGLNEAQRAQLEAAREAYRAELPEKLDTIAVAAAALTAGIDSASLETLYQLVHRLAGSAAVFGFHHLSRTAASLEEVVVSLREAGASDARRAELTARALALAGTLEASVVPVPVDREG